MEKQCNVINFNLKKYVREVSDFKIRNFLWFFSLYENHIEDDIKKDLMIECKKEATRRGIELDD